MFLSVHIIADNRYFVLHCLYSPNLENILFLANLQKYVNKQAYVLMQSRNRSD